MELSGGPESKKARWSPNAYASSATSVATNGNIRTDLFANYGYGNQAAVNQATAAAFGSASHLNGNQLYSTPTLTVNTNTNGVSMASQMSPSSATSAFTPQMPQTQQPGQVNGGGAANVYGGYGGYGMNGMLGMGMPGMNMLGVGSFPYSPQIGSFQQVCGNTFPFIPS